jgi:putative transposase
MLSNRDRLSAVRRCIKRDHRVGLTIRETRSPTENALRSWHSECEQLLDLLAGQVRQPRYPPAQKERAVQHDLEHGRSMVVTIKALGYPSRSLLSAWIQALHPQERTRSLIDLKLTWSLRHPQA